MLKTPEPIEFTVKNPDGHTMTMTFNWDADVKDLLEAFRVILHWNNFQNIMRM